MIHVNICHISDKQVGIKMKTFWIKTGLSCKQMQGRKQEKRIKKEIKKDTKEERN